MGITGPLAGPIRRKIKDKYGCEGIGYIFLEFHKVCVYNLFCYNNLTI